MGFICENCQKNFDSGYGTKNRFCSKNCCYAFVAKKGTIVKARNVKVGYCKLCGKKCKNENSLKNHEIRCPKNSKRASKNCGGRKKGKTYKQKNSNYILKCRENKIVPDITPYKSWQGKKHTNEQKNKISESMKIAHAEGRAYHWKRRVSEPSRPEKFLIEVLKNEFQMKENKDYEREVYYHGFFLDFVWKEKKLVIEMDGEQHQTSQVQIERDKRKDALLKAEGFKELRIPWKDCFNNPKDYILKIGVFLNQ